MGDSTDKARAAALVTAADRMHVTVRASATWRYVGWLSGVAVATVLYFASLAVAVDDRAVLIVSAAFGLCIAGLSLGLLPGATATPVGFPRRWASAVMAWGTLFGLAMALGMVWFRGDLAFWAVAAVACAAPLVAGARAEARA